ncbi:MAG: DegT/DnrJ/EryC1/StrS family aminotransferase [Candidatus Kapabacteria bacterium]|nr:DegT/DnrJ/EryC1/StrS family aminotransferase [Candidatus Kapabacteria bacterium]
MMQFIDLKRQYARIEEEVQAGFRRICENAQFIMGSDILKLEVMLADYVGRKYCLSCSSGTDALLIPLMAWGIGKGDAVFTTPFTFIATSEVVVLTGATPIFVDIDRKTYNISTSDLERVIEKTISEGKLTPKAIIPVDLFGLTADYDEINRIAKKYNLLVLEDAAQGFGGVYKGKRACSFGDVAATSFFPAKPLGCYGDGGAVFTDDENLIEIFKSIRIHGQGSDKYDNIRTGINGRLDTLQAIVLIEKLKIFDEELEKRNQVAKKYGELLKNKLVVPFIPDDCVSSWAQYSVLAESAWHRSELQQKLKENDIPTAIYYPIPLHLQTAYKKLGYKKGDFPISEEIASRIFSLPMHPYLTDEEIEFICSKIN